MSIQGAFNLVIELVLSRESIVGRWEMFQDDISPGDGWVKLVLKSDHCPDDG